MFTTIAFYVCWQIFATVVFDPLLDWADHEWENLSDKEKREMEEMSDDDDPLLFLPFPFTTKEVKQPPYKGSDPEWLAFLAVNKDQQAQKDIKCTSGPYPLYRALSDSNTSRTSRNHSPRRGKESRLYSAARGKRCQVEENVAGYHIPPGASTKALCIRVRPLLHLHHCRHLLMHG